MTATRTRVGAVLLLAALSLLSACGGGFNGQASQRSSGPVSFAHYVALGDGFAAAPYLGRDTSGNGCLRSPNNYPAQVARSLKVGTITDVTCVGATTKDLTSTSTPPRSAKKLAAQLDAVHQDTDLVTIGIGIEDNNLLQGMFHICSAEPCGSQTLFPVLSKQLDAYGAEIAAAIRTIQDVAANPTIVIVGYPQLMPAAGLCSALPAITELQLGYSSKILDLVNSFLRSAAGQTGASYIDVASLSRDKTACSKTPWVSGAKTVAGRSRAFHPVQAEQDAVARAILDQVRIVSQSRQ